MASSSVSSRLVLGRGWNGLFRQARGNRRNFSNRTSIADILQSVQDGSMNLQEAEQRLSSNNNNNNSKVLESFANLDHTRSLRTGFPEVVFAETKTPQQVAMIMDDMARHVNSETLLSNNNKNDNHPGASAAILATRVTPEMNHAISSLQLEHGTLTYHEQARILSMKANALEQYPPTNNNNSSFDGHVVVATAGTTDLPVAEEAAVVLEAAGVTVERIYDVGVAGLHRVVRALPRLQDDTVGAVIVCAGMDGALPSVVGGLVHVPVFACPTSIGYGVSLGGVSAMLTMLNSCAPGVSVLNVDNGFGAAACAFKVVARRKK
ncbi:AIRC [Seminavis robusta]|uniref:phosphoribosylaminoimidazole carboxylase n=1 Tax=Seminavis robusta TaxID=568900 RepID=A0A9N8EC09_9STRA|nr:AIRC [Seminavis robusta]|eukprot:Sro903_g218220.1 AIRC (321) ;mRNA; f:9280-10337